MMKKPMFSIIELRRKVGMVFQKSNPFPKSIFENVVYGLRIAGITDKKKLKEAAEISLQRAALAKIKRIVIIPGQSNRNRNPQKSLRSCRA